MRIFLKTINILSGDPGRYGDPFGVINQVGTYPEKKIHVVHAKQFIKEKYGIVAKHFQQIQNKSNPDYMLLESNRREDKKVLELFQTKYNLPLKGINTSANLTYETRLKGYSMDKPFMINWFKLQKKNHNIIFEGTEHDMEILIEQIPQIVGIITPGGNTSYKAQRGRHDDLFMAFLIGANMIRLWWDKMDRRNNISV